MFIKQGEYIAFKFVTGERDVKGEVQYEKRGGKERNLHQNLGLKSPVCPADLSAERAFQQSPAV